MSILDTIESSDPTDFCGDGLLATVPNELARLLRTASREPLDLASWINPLENTHDYTLDELRSLVAKQLKQDIDEAAAGGFSPIKAALNEVAIARQHVSLLFQNGVTHDQDGNKLRKDFMKFGQMVGSGPPLFRSRQLLALIDAGVVTPVGPSPSVEVVDSDVRVTSGSRTIAGSSLANAFLPGPDVRRHTDPLTESLMSRGRIRPFKIGEKLTGSPETDALTHRVVGPNGCLDSRLHIVGVPTRAQWADTILSPRPEPNSLFLQETDHIAASVVNRLIDES